MCPRPKFIVRDPSDYFKFDVTHYVLNFLYVFSVDSDTLETLWVHVGKYELSPIILKTSLSLSQI